MKFNKLLILSILLLAVLTIGAVSANDNMTDDAVSTDDDVGYALTEDGPSDDSDDWPEEIEIHLNYGTNEVVRDEPLYFTATINGGKLETSIDGKKVTATDLGGDEVDEGYNVPTKGLGVGNHTLNVKFTNCREYKDIDQNFTFYIRDIVVIVPDTVYANQVLHSGMTVGIPYDDAGTLVVTIDGKADTYTKKASTRCTKYYSLEDLSTSNNPHTVKVTYKNSKGFSYNKTFNVTATYKIDLQDKTFMYTEPCEVRFRAPSQLSQDKLRVKIDNKEYNPTKSSGDYYYVNAGSLSLGNHTVVVSYQGDDKVGPIQVNATLTVNPYISFSGRIEVGNNITLKAYLPEEFNFSNFTLYVDQKLYCSTVFDQGQVVIPISGLNVGAHVISSKITGNYNYTYTKWAYVYITISSPIPTYVGESNNFVITLSDTEGNVTADFDGVKVIAPFIDGKATIPTPTSLKVGWYNVTFSHSGKKAFNFTEVFQVSAKFVVPSTVTNGNGYVYMKLPYDEPNAKFVVEIYNKKDKYVFTSKFVNGKASIPLSSINNGKYTVFPKYFDGKEWEYHGTWDMTVNNNKLFAGNLVKYYGSSTAFKVKVTDYKGKIVKNQYVKFYINGKYVKKVKTNKNGWAFLKIGKAPGSYKIAAKYGKIKITRDLTVKHAVTLKTATVERSAKSLVLKATLTAGINVLKYKKVTFKFHGIKYTAKTNKYGIAKVTIKKAVLKKLKVGKTVKYQATYGKDTVKKSAIVKK